MVRCASTVVRSGLTYMPPLKAATGAVSFSGSTSVAMPARRPSAGDGELDAGGAQAVDGLARPRGEDLVFASPAFRRRRR